MAKLFSLATAMPPGQARRWLSGALGLLLPALGAQAQQLAPPSFFSTDASARQAAAASPVAARLRGARPLTLNVAGMRAALATAPREGRAAAAPLLLALPLPDGSTATFRVLEAPVMAPALAAQFPAIKTYVGVGVEDPTASVRLDFTPQGFHAQVLSAATGAFYIDPASRTTTTQYLSFWKRDMPGNSFTCEVKNSRVARPAGGANQRITSRTLRTYRLALAATGEYTAYHGGTVAAAQAAMVTSVNRVVGVYEKELDVRLVLVANNSQLIYTNAATDPYSNDDGSAMLGENQDNVDQLIGNANYDIGHVFSTGGGGIAGLGVVCQPGAKAQGVTGSPAPVGDAFDIDYVAHEMGHQFGGNHTFNSTAGSCNGNRNPSTAYEPGSGSTIMAYAGICSASDLQPNSDPYFHVASFEEIQAYIGTTQCAATSSTGNSAPVVTLPAGGKVMPIGTPFRLTGNAYDQDGDALSYCWEEFDLGGSGSPTATQTANNNVPLFRSFNPTASPTRYFPRLSSLVDNTVVIGERLPTVSRSLKFRLTVRDQHLGAQGIVGGINSGFSTVDLTTTSAAGPFLVTAPNTAATWAGGTSETVTWNVAGTTANGVNCATVNIRLSTDGGLTYPTVLLANTANDGTESVTVPTVSTTTARIMVEAADNYFFDISNANFTIVAPATPCVQPSNLAVSSLTRTTASVSFTGSGAASYTVTTSPATTTRTTTTSPVSLTGLTAGTTYTVSITGNCGSAGSSATATTTFATPAPPACNEATNLAVRNVTGTGATFSFTPDATAGTYTIATVPATTTQTVAAGPVSFTNLTPGTNYTIFITSNCAGGGTVTDALAFATRPGNDECSTAVSLTSGTSCVTTAGTLTGATESRPASACSGYVSPSANDVWYTFVATGPTHTIRAAGTPDGVLEVLTGTCGSLSSLGCIDASGSGGETFSSNNFVRGTRYYVRYYAYGLTPTDGTFTICVTNPACNPPTALALAASTATSLTVSFTAASGTNAASYTATATPSAGGAAQTVTATTSPVTFGNLTPGTSYVVSIATNCTNSGPSATATATFSTAAALTDLTVSTAQAVGGAYNNVTITGTGAATLASSLTVNGVLTVQSGGSLQTDATFDVQGPGSLVLAAGATLIEVNATGLANATGGGFALTGAAGLSFSPDANYVFVGTAAQQTGPLLPNGARNLTVNNPAGVTLTNNLAVRQVVRLQSGNLTLNGKVLRLLSTAAGTALVDNTGGAVLGSTASMQRAITGGVQSGPAYRHFSSPVAAVAVDSLGTGGVAPVFNPAYNTSATPSLVTPFPTVFGYNQDRIATTTSNYGDFDKGFFSPASGSDVMTPSRGYTVNTPPTATPVRFTGTFNTGAQSVGPLARANATAATGWQLLGNPYPSPLDWSTVTSTQRPGVGAAMYVFESTSQYNGVYRTYVNGMGSASPLIEAGSGYFVQVAAAGTTGSVNLTNANRVTTFGTQTPFGRPAADPRPQLQLRVAGAGFTDEAYLYFEAGATAGVDADYDATKLPNSTGLNLAALAGSAPLAIQGLAPLTGTAEVVVPLALATPVAGSFAFEVADLANFAGLSVYLRDTQAGTQQPLLAGTRYAFTQAVGAATTGRFALVFRPAGVLATQPGLSAAQVSVFPNPAHGSFTVQLPPLARQRAVQATLLSVLGQPVASRSIALNAAGASAEFDTRGLAAGVYVLRLVAGDQVLTQRLTVE
ncbi:MAG TPA: zinc-dependent metalloprotease family protein [Hymenobacter sp.]|uniref:reprolysin-like metallopeptidase n=1 Tax=Hymenobacter sp. TaxID=1898978 RepID=UPI002D7F5011|nr:zinc-dependent metalloprotease family protein [Hymenobacter sp.]HET9503484.1 zinc-dependent metalloprotease family protein [Hymenobacter sp.]